MNGVSSDKIEAFSLLTVIAIGSIVGFALCAQIGASAGHHAQRGGSLCTRERDGKKMKVGEQLVPGDIVILEAGDSVPRMLALSKRPNCRLERLR